MKKHLSNNFSSSPNLTTYEVNFKKIPKSPSTGCLPSKVTSDFFIKRITPKKDTFLDNEIKQGYFYTATNSCTKTLFKDPNIIRFFSGDIEGELAAVLHLVCSGGIIPNKKFVSFIYHNNTLEYDISPLSHLKLPSAKISIPDFSLLQTTQNLLKTHTMIFHSTGDIIDRGALGLECLLSITHLCNKANTETEWKNIHIEVSMGNHDIAYFLTPHFARRVTSVSPNSYSNSTDSQGFFLVKAAFQKLLECKQQGSSGAVFCKVDTSNMLLFSHAPVTEGKNGFLPLLKQSWHLNPEIFKEKLLKYSTSTELIENIFNRISNNLGIKSADVEYKNQWLKDIEISMNLHLELPSFFDNTAVKVPLPPTLLKLNKDIPPINILTLNTFFDYLISFFKKRHSIPTKNILHTFKTINSFLTVNDKKESYTDLTLENFRSSINNLIDIIELCPQFTFELNFETKDSLHVIEYLKKLIEQEKPSYTLKSYVLKLVESSQFFILDAFNDFHTINIATLPNKYTVSFNEESYSNYCMAINKCYNINDTEISALTLGHIFHFDTSPCWVRFCSNSFDENFHPIFVNSIHGHDTGGTLEPAEIEFKHEDTTYTTVKIDTAQSSQMGNNRKKVIHFDNIKRLKVYETIPITLSYFPNRPPVITSISKCLKHSVFTPKRGFSQMILGKIYESDFSAKLSHDLRSVFLEKKFPNSYEDLGRIIALLEDLSVNYNSILRQHS